MRIVSLLAVAVALVPATAFAQTATAPGAPPAAQDDDHHDHDEEIVVTGVRRKAGDVLGGLCMGFAWALVCGIVVRIFQRSGAIRSKPTESASPL